MGVLVWGRRRWSVMLAAVSTRIERGDTLKLGVGGVSAELSRFAEELQREAAQAVRLKPGDKPADLGSEEPMTDSLARRRREIGRTQRGVHLVHVAVPSSAPGQEYEIFVYLSGWRRSAHGCPDDLSDVKEAEFYLGSKFSPSGTRLKNTAGQRLGFVTSAYGPVICACRVTFADGHEATLSRYLDFEAARFTERTLQRE